MSVIAEVKQKYDFSDDERHADVSPTVGDLHHFLEVNDELPQ